MHMGRSECAAGGIYQRVRVELELVLSATERRVQPQPIPCCRRLRHRAGIQLGARRAAG